MARPHPALFDLAAGRPMGHVADFDLLVVSAVEHHMQGLLWSSVVRGEIDGPLKWKTVLAGHDLELQERHHRLWKTIADVTARLGAIGVETAVLKGVPSEQRWYGRTGERPSVDVDLLIGPASLHRANEIVATLAPAHELRDSVQDNFDRWRCQSIDLRVGGVGVDLHLDPFKLGPPTRDRDGLWRHTMPFLGPGGICVRVLDPELSLVHFMVHMNRDSYRWLLGFADVVRILRCEDLDWDEVARLAADEGVEVPVWAGLAVVAKGLGVTLPYRRSATGYRARLWSVLWRPSVRLQGSLGLMRYRHRFYWLPIVTHATLPEALRWYWGQFVLSAAVANQSNPGRRGPWWWRMVRGRIGREVERRRGIALLRRAEVERARSAVR